MKPTCLRSTVQPGIGSVMMWGIFLEHIEPINTHQASFDCCYQLLPFMATIYSHAIQSYKIEMFNKYSCAIFHNISNKIEMLIKSMLRFLFVLQYYIQGYVAFREREYSNVMLALPFTNDLIKTLFRQVGFPRPDVLSTENQQLTRSLKEGKRDRRASLPLPPNKNTRTLVISPYLISLRQKKQKKSMLSISNVDYMNNKPTTDPCGNNDFILKLLANNKNDITLLFTT